MYNYSYEEYMNNLLGYNPDITARNLNNTIIQSENNYNTYNEENGELEKYYPDIYRTVYPMVRKSCLYIHEEITEELIEKITNDIYNSLELEEVVGEQNNYSNFRSNRNMRNNRNAKYNEETEKRQKDFLLNDLIKILVLRELIGFGRKTQRLFPPIASQPVISMRPSQRPPRF